MFHKNSNRGYGVSQRSKKYTRNNEFYTGLMVNKDLNLMRKSVEDGISDLEIW